MINPLSGLDQAGLGLMSPLAMQQGQTQAFNNLQALSQQQAFNQQQLGA